MPDEDRVAELLAEYFERVSGGEAVEPEAFVGEHPEVADALREHLAFAPVVDEVFASETRAPERLGAFRVLERLGTGGMGTVYRAVDESAEPGAEVALKLVHPHLLQRPGFFKRFLREAEVGRAVEHPNVVRTHDVDALVRNGAAYHFLVMEYVEGQTLRGLLDELEVVPEELCRHIGQEVAKGLVAIHEAGVVHRDLKPDNVIITADHVVKVMDLGVARLADEAIRLSQTGHFVGSVEYAAPEQFASGREGVDTRADLFSLGVVLYELATGRHPFRDESAKVVLQRILHDPARKAGELNPQLSPFLEEVIHALLAKEAAGRFQTAGELLEVLEEGERGAWWKERAHQLHLETKRPLRRIRVPRETALYGRDDDLAGLGAAWQRAKAGEGQVLLIEGEAGIGKTRLVDEFVSRLQQAGEDLNFLFGSYPPGGAATAAGAFATAFREHFGVEGLEDALRDHLTVSPLLAPALAALLRGEPSPGGTQPLTKDSMQSAFVHVTRSLGRQRPTVLLLEDLHFAGDDGRALFAALAYAVREQRLLVIGTLRPGVPESWVHDLTRLDYVRPVPLSRLGPKDLADLLRDTFQSERLAEELAYRIGLKSDGNPFFVFEIVRGLKEGQFLRRRPDGSWVTTRIIRDLEVPSSVLDLVGARVAALERTERDLLDLASCCGYDFDPLLVAEAAGSAPIPVLQALAGIEKRHRLVRSAGARMVFDHHQVQEALYAAMPGPLAVAYHAEIAEALERRAGAAASRVDGAHAVDIAEHWVRGAEPRRALPWLDDALTHLAAAWQRERIVALLTAVLGAEGLVRDRRRVELLLRLEGQLDLGAQRDEQEETLREALAISEAEGDRALEQRVHRALGNLCWRTGRFEEAETHHTRALDMARVEGDVDAQAAALINRGNARGALQRRDDAARDQRRGLALARRCGNRRWEVNARMNLGIQAEDEDDYERALEFHAGTLRLAAELGDRLLEARAHGNVGRVLRLQGRYTRAAEHLERYVHIAREIGDRRGVGVAASNLAMLQLDAGRWRAAREELERYEAIALETGDRSAELVAVSGLGNLAWRTGYLAESRDHFLCCLDIERQAGNPVQRAISTGNLGLLTLGLGQTEEARSLLNESLALARRFEMRRVESYQLHALALADLQEGDVDAARVQAGEALAVREGIHYRKGIAETRALLGRLQALAGEHTAAREAYQDARTLARKVGLQEVALLCDAALIRLGGSSNDVVSAYDEIAERLGCADRMEIAFALWQGLGHREHLGDAKRGLDHLLEHAPAEYRASMQRCVPLHRAILEA